MSGQRDGFAFRINGYAALNRFTYEKSPALPLIRGEYSIRLCRRIDALRNLVANRPFLHPAHGEQIADRGEEAIPDAVVAFPRESCVMVHRDFGDGVALDLEQGRHKPVHSLEEFQVRGALALEDTITAGESLIDSRVILFRTQLAMREEQLRTKLSPFRRVCRREPQTQS